jgi:hypothetical protein
VSHSLQGDCKGRSKKRFDRGGPHFTKVSRTGYGGNDGNIPSTVLKATKVSYQRTQGLIIQYAPVKYIEDIFKDGLKG